MDDDVGGELAGIQAGPRCLHGVCWRRAEMDVVEELRENGLLLLATRPKSPDGLQLQ